MTELTKVEYIGQKVVTKVVEWVDLLNKMKKWDHATLQFKLGHKT